MENINQRIKNLLTYARKNLDLSEEGRAIAENRLLELLQTEPSYDEETCDEDIEAVLNDITLYAVENGIVDEELADRFPDKLIDMVMPSQDDVVKTYESLHYARGRELAERYFLRLNRNSRYILPPPPGAVGWKVVGYNGDFIVVIPTVDREEDEESFYPRCPRCLQDVGFCGLPNKASSYSKRVLPFNLAGEKWYFSYVRDPLYSDEYIASYEKHRSSGPDRSVAAMCDLAEKVPTGFVGTRYKTEMHDSLFGGRRELPIFERPIKKELYNGNFVVSSLVWNFPAIRIMTYIKSDMVLAATKIIKYWRDYSEDNVVYPAFYCTDIAYMADIVFMKKGGATPLFDGIDYLAAMGVFILPAQTADDFAGLTKAFGEQNIDFGKINASETLNKYLEWAIQIAASKGAGLSPTEMRDALIAVTGETCIKAAAECSFGEAELENIVTEALKGI